MGKPLELNGRRFGRLVAIQFSHSAKRQRYWQCECDCGGSVTVRAADLSRGNTQSCGCLQSERTAEHNLKHGLSKLPEYSVWSMMIQRCENPNVRNFHRYGGRGIKVCSRWKNSFEEFYSDMGPRPFPKAQIDRENNNGNYEPNNCRWATQAENLANRGY